MCRCKFEDILGKRFKHIPISSRLQLVIGILDLKMVYEDC